MADNLEKNIVLEPERYELEKSSSYRFALDRRSFLGVAGAGLLVTVQGVSAPAQSRGDDSGPSISARLHIGTDGHITVMTSKVEVGQGSRTQISQAAAEELKVPLERITLIMADTDLVPDDGGTFGSRTTPATVPSVRKGAAAAREILIDLAQQKWGIDRQSLKVEGGKIIDPSTDRTLDYADLARSHDLAEAFGRAIPPGVTVTPVDQWQILGKSAKRVTGRDIVTGAHRYPSDMVRPNMLYGSILRAPSYGATLAGIDLSAAKRIPGVVVVQDRNFVGCAAPTSLQARSAVDALQKSASWETASQETKFQTSGSKLFAYLKQNAVTGGSGRSAPRVRSSGSVEEGFAGAEKILNAAYEVAYIQHGPMEPRAAVAEWQGGKLTVWTGTQRPHGVREELAQAFHIPEERVRVIVPDSGGAFGGKHTGEAAVEAARLAKAADRPVSLCWTREEEFTWAYFRPAALIEAKAGLGADGRLLAWQFTNFNSGASALDSPYEIPHSRQEFRRSDSPLRQGSYRVLAATANTFARESFMDELAYASNQDPLDYRLAHLDNQRLRAVLEAAAKRFGWRERRQERQPNRGVGLACGTGKGSYAAACVEVEVDRQRGGIRVLDVCQSFECGAIQNPDNLRAQVEGCVIMALGGALREEIRFENGRILNGRFSQYAVPRFKDIPPIETVLLDRSDLDSAGAGETPMIALAPAIANAVFNACSVRVRSMPIRLGGAGPAP